MAVWYCSSVGYTAVTQWAASTSYNIGDLRRQLAAPTAGNERVFRCTTAGTSHSSEPTWTITKGGTTNDNDVVWTEVTGNSTYGWTAAHALATNADDWAAAGDTIYISHQHVETVTATTLDIPNGTATAPLEYVCVNDGATPPTTLATTALLGQSSGSSLYTITGHAYFYGCRIRGQRGLVLGGTAGPTMIVLDNCILDVVQAGAAYVHRFGSGGSTSAASTYLYLNNTKLARGDSDLRAILQVRNCRAVWANTDDVIASGNTPFTTFIGGTAYSVGQIEFRQCGLQAYDSGKSLVDVGGGMLVATFEQCRLANSVAITTGASDAGRVDVELVNCDSSSTNYRYYKETSQGVIQHESTIIRTGGATDGTTGVSRKMVSSAGAQFYLPLELNCNVQWNETTGSELTATVHVVTDNVTLTNAECWLEVEYLSSSSYPIGSIVSDRATDIMTAAANQTASTETWTTTGLSTPVKQQLSVSFTPQMKGPIRCRVMLAKASTTVYVCPKVEIA